MRKSIAFAACSAFVLGGCIESGTEALTADGTATVSGSASVEGSVSASSTLSTTAATLEAMVQSIYGLGPCNTSNDGNATYVVDEESYFQCSGGMWSEQKSSVSIENSCSISGDNNVVFCGNATVGTLVIGGSSALDSNIAYIAGKDGKDGKDGSSCTVEALADNSGYKILCGGDSVGVLLNGVNGKDGADGRDGIDGKDGVDGTNGIDGKDGADGRDGIDGVNGSDGADGTSCTVEALADGSGYKMLCGGDSVGVVLNGTNGKDGVDGRDGVDGKDGADGRDGIDGVDGNDGADGISCTVEAFTDGSGYKILCGGDSVGVIYNGTNGTDGKDGTNGKDGTDGIDGKDGASCSIVPLADGSGYKLSCGYADDTASSSSSSSAASGVTKAAWDNLNPDIDYCEFQDTRDGQWYKCVVIGSQTWMAENLNYANTATESWCFEGKDENCDTYGRLYTWAAAANLSSDYNNYQAGISGTYQGACPIGWHLPTNAEWNTLANVVSKKNSLVGKALLSKTYGGTDDVGFSAMYAGNWKDDTEERTANYDKMGEVADFWTASESTYRAIRRNIGYYDNTSLNAEYEEKYEWGYSVRCVKD